MITRNKAKLISALRIPKYRKKHGLFVAEGTKLILELLESTFGIDEIYATSDWIKQHREAFRHVDHLVIRVEQKDIDTVSSLSTAPEVMAIVNMPDRKNEPIRFSGIPTIMLDGINDPGNLAALSARPTGLAFPRLFAAKTQWTPNHPKVVQASMGSIFRLRIYEADLIKVLQNKAEMSQFMGPLWMAKAYINLIKSHGIYIIGSESHGISSRTQQDKSISVLPYRAIALMVNRRKQNRLMPPLQPPSSLQRCAEPNNKALFDVQ